MNLPKKKNVLFSCISASEVTDPSITWARGCVFFPALLVILPSGSLITQDEMGILHRDEDGLIVLILQKQDSVNLTSKVIPILLITEIWETTGDNSV